jgi:hypothetical protein
MMMACVPLFFWGEKIKNLNVRLVEKDWSRVCAGSRNKKRSQ